MGDPTKVTPVIVSCGECGNAEATLHGLCDACRLELRKQEWQ